MLQRIKKRWFSRLYRAHGFVKIVEPWGILFAASALLLSVVQFWWEYGDRVEERQVRAWQLVTTFAPGNSGKIEALEYLNSEDGLFCFELLKGKLEWLHDDKNTKCLILFKSRVPLVGINLSRSANDAVDNSSTNLPGVFLVGVDLREAILQGARLSDADLRGAILRHADLIGADLRRAALIGADLYNADLRHADLIGADLRRANLRDANLRHADLRDADLNDADLSYADLRNTDLGNADLSDANLNYANLSYADLRNTDLGNADLSYADLSGALILKSSQFENTCGNSSTKLPKGLTIKFCK